MKQERRRLFYPIFLLVFFIQMPSTYADIGSNTAVTRFDTVQTVNDESILGFAALAGGFSLASNATIAVFDSFFPVIGPVDLNQATLRLNQDLIFHDVSELIQEGTIWGNNHTLQASASMETLPFAGTNVNFTFSTINYVLNSDVTINNTRLLFQGDCVIDGQGNSLTFDNASRLSVDTASSLALKNITLINIKDSNIVCNDATSTFTFENMNMILGSNFIFGTGKINVIGDVNIIGDSFACQYSSDQISTIESNAHLILNNGVTFQYNPLIAASNLIQWVDHTSQLILNGASFTSTRTPLQFLSGTMVVDGRSTIRNSATVDAEAMIFGDGITRNNNFNIQILPSATLEFSQGRIIDLNI